MVIPSLANNAVYAELNSKPPKSPLRIQNRPILFQITSKFLIAINSIPISSLCCKLNANERTSMVLRKR